MRRRVLPLALLVVVFQAGASAAAVSSAQAYRERLNGVCRGYTPTLKRVEADALRARKAGNGNRVFFDLGLSVELALREDAAIEAVPVPAELQSRMRPILSRLRTIDNHARGFVARAGAGDPGGALTEMATIGRLARPLDAMLDRAGLRDCGSNQS
jgi:hypothetical protein